MAIRIIQGVPGSGKTYYAVRHLASQYFERQEDGRYELVKPCTIITNIDSFQPAHICLQDAIKEAGGVKQYFTEPYQKEYSKRFEHQIVYIIDEAQKYFRKNDRDLNEVYTYFELHRHLGHDIYLITQNAKKLPTDLVVLTEYIIDAAPRSRSVIGEFKYKWLSDGEILKREGFKPDKGIFALYKSMDVQESEKVTNPVMKTFWILISLCFLVIGGGVYYFKSQWLGPSKKATSESEQTTVDNKSAQSISSPVQQKEPEEEKMVSIRINSASFYLRMGEKGRERVKINYVFWDNRFFRIEEFPYHLEKQGVEWFATVPEKEAYPSRSSSEPVESRSRRLRSDWSEANGAGVVFSPK